MSIYTPSEDQSAKIQTCLSNKGSVDCNYFTGLTSLGQQCCCTYPRVLCLITFLGLAPEICCFKELAFIYWQTWHCTTCFLSSSPLGFLFLGSYTYYCAIPKPASSLFFFLFPNYLIFNKHNSWLLSYVIKTHLHTHKGAQRDNSSWGAQIIPCPG